MIKSIIKQAQKPEEKSRIHKITQGLKEIIEKLEGNQPPTFCGESIQGHEKVCGSLLMMNDKLYIYPQTYGDLDDIDFGYGFVEIDKWTLREVAQ